MVAALSVILFYYKLADNIYDGGFFAKIGYGTLSFATRAWKNKARRRFPEMEERVRVMMEEQRAAESRKDCSPDEAAHPTADVVSYLAALLSEDAYRQKKLERFGYHLGRWIYFIDAHDDLIKDVKKGNFNPIALRFFLTKTNIDDEQLLKNAKEYANGLLNMSIAEAIAEFDELELELFAPVLNNILRLGMSASQETVFKGRNKNDK